MAKKSEATTSSNFTATISESSRELTPKERVMFKDTGNAKSMVDYAHECAEAGARAIIDFKDFVVVNVHNEAVEDKDYINYILIDKEGNKFYTCSESFWNSFKNIYAEMKDSDEDWGVELNLLPSKNYKGKEILTCSLV